MEVKNGLILDRKLEEIINSEEGYSTFRFIENELFDIGELDNVQLMFTGCGNGEGKSTVSVLYAIMSALFNDDLKVLHLDLSTGSEAINKKLKIEYELDDEYVMPNTGLRGSVTSVENLHLVYRDGNNKASFQSIRGIQKYISALKKIYDIIIIDTDSPNRSPDTLSYAKLFENVVVVLGYGTTTYEQAEPVVKELKQTRCNVLGAVMNHREYPIPKWLYGKH